MPVTMTAGERDAVIRVNLRGHVCPARHATVRDGDRP
jgi:hypothetical protein